MLETLRSVLRFRRPTLSAAGRRLATAADVDDLRRLARRRLPGGVFDYIDGAAEDEITLERNRTAFRRLEFRPRVLRGVTEIDTTTRLLGRPTPLPLVLAPTGFTRIADPDGELAVARAAARAGVPYCLSTLSTRSIEEVAAASDSVAWAGEGERRLWFQVYVWRDRGLVADMIRRAADARYEALVLTVDTPVLGRRERDVRRGFTLPPEIGLDTLLDGARHPGWTWRFVRSEPIRFANVVGASVGDGSDAVSLSAYINSQFDRSLSWADVDWLRRHWDGPVVLKGIQCVDDAVRAAEVGVDAIALSNHGGRQLDGAPPPLELVEPVVDAVGDRLEVICDGGIRRGADLVRVVALGARAGMAGRAYLYGLGAAGEAGVDHVLDLFDTGLRRTLALLGVTDLAELGRDHVAWRPSTD